MKKTCPVTKLPIARRFAVHHSVLTESIAKGLVIRNPSAGTLRQYIYLPKVGYRYDNHSSR